MGSPAVRYEQPSDLQPVGIASLRGWLQGKWALLFSHADDFASYGFEADRWLVHVRDAFESRGIRPMSLASSADALVPTWIAEVGGSALSIRTSISQRLAPILNEGERGLFAAVVSASSRFVMIVDDSLRLRRTFAYSAGDRLPSPMELASMAEKLRRISVDKVNA
jgi:hypothetical protein